MRKPRSSPTLQLAANALWKAQEAFEALRFLLSSLQKALNNSLTLMMKTQ